MAGDQPSIFDQHTPRDPSDLNAILDLGSRGAPRPDAVQRPQDTPVPGQTGDAVKIGTDATNTVVICNKTLELNYNDVNFDNKLNYASAHGADKFNVIQIDNLPTNIKIKSFIDQNGYFFWYDDGTNSPKAHHYLPDNAAIMKANSSTINLEMERIKDNQAFAEMFYGGFRNFDRSFVPANDGARNSTAYYSHIAAAPWGALNAQEHALRESVRTDSNNPYFKIYLSDVMAAQAIKYAHEQPVQPNNQYTRRKIDDALSLSSAAYDQTKTELGKINNYPALNVYLPLSPESPYWNYNRAPNDYMKFWGGGFNQSYGREQNLTYLRGLIISNVIPRT